MPFLGIGKEEESLESLQEANERLKVKADNQRLEYSIAQKQMAMRKMKEAGVKGSDFGWNWSRIMNWIKGK